MSAGHDQVEPLPVLPVALSDQLLPLLFGDPERRQREFEELLARHPEHRVALKAHWRHHMGLEQQEQIDGESAIPGYRLLAVLGEGGMGTVYRAEQLVPVHRLVALKVIKQGMDSKAVLQRFEQERQSLAAMDHDAIAKVFDCGTNPRGQPYFAMELVEGLPIHRYCDQHKLSLRHRIELFAQVCQGVQHAHQKGVIHRDLKPGNVLVVDQGGRHAVKIIDFGVARATDRRLAIGSLFTEQGMIVGTPEYMSPEQAAGESRRIDTRTDIYALGVILYELLVGALPFPAAELREAGLVEIVRRLREDEPPKPSTRLTTLGREATTCAALRQVSVEALRRELAGDLDWVVLKAMAKEPERRYESATAFAEDLQRYLEHEPLRAGPPSGWYQVRKYLRRHRGPLLAAGAVIAALATGLTFALVQYGKAEDARAGLASALEDRGRALDDVQAQRTVARTHLARYELLADMVTLPDLEREADSLWPEVPDKAPAMVDWLTRARELVTHRARVAAALEELKARGRPLTSDEKEVARRRHPRAQELAQRQARLLQARQELATLKNKKELSEAAKTRGQRLSIVEIPPLEQTTEVLTAEIEATLLPRFPSAADQFLHDTLVKLVEGLGRLETETIAAVAKRQVWANAVPQRTVVDEQAAWDRAIASIANTAECPLYRGYKLTPQLGLVPLDRNPQSGLWEFWHVRSGERPDRDASDRQIVGDDTGIVFVLIPGGTFWMGAQKSGQNEDPNARADEVPVHEVPLVPFFLAKYEMTQGQWEQWTQRNPSSMRPGMLQRGVEVTRHNPVEQVNWEDCHRVLGQMGLALPTEAQWEYACRAGTAMVYSTGDDVATLLGSVNLADEGSKGYYSASWNFEKGFDDGHPGHAPVGSFQPNRWGLFDMHGNVFEWCRDEYGTYLRKPRPGDGERYGDRDGVRVSRGGSFLTNAYAVRSAYRYRTAPDDRGTYLGVRPAMAITP